MFPTQYLDRVRFIDVTSPDLEPWLGRTLADLIAARGGHPSDVLADWVLENDLRPGVARRRHRQQRRRRKSASCSPTPTTSSGSSDAGAHVQMMCAAGDTTLLLAPARARPRRPHRRAAVHELTGKQSDVFGFRDRGYVRPG